MKEEMPLSGVEIKTGKRFFSLSLGLTLVSGLALSGCNTAETFKLSETITQGYVEDQNALDLVPIGSSREQVLLALGSPSTTATFDTEAFYYISQKRKRGAAFMKAKLVEQKVLAVYFGPDGTVINIANYGMKDGRVFDFIKRVTPTGGKDVTFLSQVIGGLARGAPPPIAGADNKGDVY